MLSEVAKIRPHTLIMWKTDRLGRDKYVLAMAKKKIRDAGCEIHLCAIEKLAIADVAKYKDKLIVTTRMIAGT